MTDQPCERCVFVPTPDGKCICRGDSCVKFVVAGEPVSKARARFTGYGSKSRAYTPERTRAAEQRVALAFRLAGGQYEGDKEATFGVDITFHNGTRQRRDVDNMIKLVLDGLNGVAWVDDTQVMDVSARKRFVAKADARTEVTVTRIGTMDRLTKKCEHCDEDFITYESLKTQRFCSRKCGDASRRAKRERICEHCGRSFLAHAETHERRFCSRACQADYGWTAVDCNHCGNPFRRRRCHVRATNYCSDECRDTARKASRRSRPAGTCADCGGPVSRKNAERCQVCRWAYVKTQKEASA